MKQNLIIRLHSLGDVVLASGTAHSMSQENPVTFLSRPVYEPVIKRIPGDIKSMSLTGGWRELRQISAGFSTIVDLQNNTTTRLALTGRRVNRFRFSRRKRRKVLLGADTTLPWRAEEYLHAWGGKGNPDPVLERLSKPSGDNFTVGIVAGGGWPMKTIPPGVVTELARLFCDVKGARVLILGDSNDLPLSEYIVEQTGYRDVATVAGEGGISELINRIENLDLLVSPDSGPAHIAMALGVPVQVVFTSTSPALGFWSPDFKGSFMVNPIPCRPCHRHGGKKCSAGDEQCRKMLVPRELFEAALCLLQ